MSRSSVFPSVRWGVVVAGVLVVVLVATVVPDRGAEPVVSSPVWPYDLPRRARAGRIDHVPTGHRVTVPGMLDVIERTRVVFWGEFHNSRVVHRRQLRTLEALRERDPGSLVVGLEVFRVPHQPLLDAWVRGEISRTHFRERIESDALRDLLPYYWGILRFARDHSIPLLALNPPRALEHAVRERPVASMPDTLAARIPAFGSPDPYQKRWLRAQFAAHGETGRGFEVFYRVQRFWEEFMAQRLAETLASRRPGRRVVALVGAMHVKYGFGVPKALFRRRPVSYRILLPAYVPDGGAVRDTGRSSPAIPLSPGDFVWWMEPPG